MESTNLKWFLTQDKEKNDFKFLNYYDTNYSHINSDINGILLVQNLSLSTQICCFSIYWRLVKLVICWFPFSANITFLLVLIITTQNKRKLYSRSSMFEKWLCNLLTWSLFGDFGIWYTPLGTPDSSVSFYIMCSKECLFCASFLYNIWNSSVNWM